MSMRRAPQPPLPAPSSMPGWVVLLSVIAIVVSAVAIAVSVLRTSGPGATVETCRTLAWDALPDGTGLPDGWTVAAGSFYADGAGTSLAGPTPADGSAPPTLYLQVTCYGADSHLAMTRAHQSALATGATNGQLIPLGEESFSIEDPSNASTSIYIRQGGLVAILVGPTSVDPGDLELAAKAVDTALSSAGSTAVRPSPTIRASTAVPSGSTDVPSVAPSTEPSATPAHAAVELEAMLPKTVAGVTLSRQSTLGTSGLAGADPSSQSLVDSLTKLGKTPADMQIAEALDDSQSTDLQIFAFRVTGIKGTTLAQAVIDSYVASGSSGITTAKKTIGGKAVTHVMYDAGGQDDYVFVRGDVVFDVATSDPALAIQALAALP